jgi:uncharacterized protein (TIGR02996 family)
MRMFEYRDAKSAKFWSIDLQGKGFTVRFGKIGTTGQTQDKEFADEAQARKEHDKLVVEKVKKGYVEVGARPAPAPAPATTSAAKPTQQTLAASAKTGKRAKGRSRSGGVADVPALIDALGGEDWDARKSAADALAKIGPAAVEATPALLVRALGEQDRWVRESVVRALAQIGPAAVPTLVAGLHDKSELLRRVMAANVLGEIGLGAVEAVPALVTALSDEDIEASVSQALIKIGRGAVPALITALADKNSTVRTHATELLGCIDPRAMEAVPALLAALRDKHSAVRASAVRSLGQFGPAAKDAVPALVEALADEAVPQPEWPNRTVSSDVHDALKAIGPVAVPALIAAAQDKSNKGRRHAISALSNSGPAAPDAVPVLVAALADKDSAVRFSAAIALGCIGPAAAEAVPALANTLRDQHDLPEADQGWQVTKVQDVADFALRKIGSAAVPVLVVALQDEESSVRKLAAHALQEMANDVGTNLPGVEIGPIAEQVIPALIVALRDQVSAVRLAAAKALGSFNYKTRGVEAVPALSAALRDEDSSVREAAATALGHIGPGAVQAVPALVLALQDKESIVRGAAGSALAKLGPEAVTAAVPVLLEGLQHADEEVRRDCANVLGRFDPAAVAACSASAPAAAAKRPAGRPSKGPLTDPALTALLETCWENPDDDAPKLVLADWLEEHGEDVRAEVTRLHVALKDPRKSAKERDKLGKRLLALRTVHQGAWLGPALAEFGQHYGAEFCGGWLWELGLDGQGGEFVNRLLEALATAPETRWLTRLRIQGCEGEPVSLKPLASSTHLGRLTELSISCGWEGCEAVDIDDLLTSAAFPNLRRLTLTGSNIPFDLLNLAKSRHFPRLQSMTIDFLNPYYGGAPLPNVGLQAFAKSRHFPDLREVTLKDRHARQSSLDGLLALVRSPRLPRLEVIGFCFDEEEEEQPDYLAFVQALAAMPEAARLLKLSLWGYHIGDAGVEALAASPHLANLTNLNLSGNEIGDEGALTLAASPHLPHLGVLDLTNNQITERGAEALLSSPHLTGLASLDLGQNQVATGVQKALARTRPSLEVRFERPNR